MDRRSGKTSVIAIIVVASLITFAVASMFTGQRPVAVAADFLDALSKKDYKKLTELSNAPGYSQEELEGEWRRSTEEAGKYFKFIYQIKSEDQPTDTSAVVVVNFTPEAGSEVAYERRLEIPLSKVDGKWKVDVLSLNRDVYPGLPR